MASIQYLLDRAFVPPNYGDRLRAAGLNEGTSFGGSEIDSRGDHCVRAFSLRSLNRSRSADDVW